jgi:hypothetical protein
MAVVSDRLDRTESFDRHVLSAIRQYKALLDAELASMPQRERDRARRYDPVFAGLNAGWISARLTRIIPEFTRAQRQRAADSLRRLAAQGRLELELSPTGRITYLRIVQGPHTRSIDRAIPQVDTIS